MDKLCLSITDKIVGNQTRDGSSLYFQIFFIFIFLNNIIFLSIQIYTLSESIIINYPLYALASSILFNNV